jgi:4-hydroxyphenylpyruvate dioxygenase
MENDFLPLLGTDYIEFYVGNAKQGAHYYKSAFGFRGIAYAGPETGVRDRVSYAVRQNSLTFVFTSALRPDHEISQQVLKHGDAVKAIALMVDDAESAWKETTKRAAKSYMEPQVLKDKNGELGLSGIHLYGDTVHLFVERKNYHGVFMPGYEAWESDYEPASTGLLYVDHCVGNVGWNQMNRWVSFYEEVMGFKNILTFDDTDISTEYSALMSKVMSNGNGMVKFPINEPAEGKKKSQVEEFLEFFNGEGVQHVALATNNIVETVGDLMRRGVEFLKVPNSYYDELEERVGKIDEDLKPLKELGILVDRDPDGYLLQIFSKPVQDRPTVFFEVIQRKGARSFGKGNFKALFEAIEREQEKRGNL